MPLSINENNVRKTVLSFPADSTGGLDGMQPQHLKNLVQCRESGSDFLTMLTGFINMVFAGRCPVNISLLFFDGRLITLSKKPGGIWPIAVSMKLRRQSVKMCQLSGISRLVSYFSLWAQVRGWRSSCCGRTLSGLEPRGPSHLLLWSDCWCFRPTQPCLQTGSRQYSQTSAPEWPATKEPVSLICSNSKCPDRMTQITWYSGKLLVCDVTVVSTTAESNVSASAWRQGRWQKWLPPGNVRSTLSCPWHTCSFQLLWRLWAQWMTT